MATNALGGCVTTNTTAKCASCSLRKRWETSPRSFLGRFWKFHTKFCPGWAAYLRSLSATEQEAIHQHLQLHGSKNT